MSDKINILSELWTTKQAADYLGTTVKSLTTQRYLGRLKDLKHYRIGHKVMYKKVDLDNWIEAHAENAYGDNMNNIYINPPYKHESAKKSQEKKND